MLIDIVISSHDFKQKDCNVNKLITAIAYVLSGPHNFCEPTQPDKTHTRAIIH